MPKVIFFETSWVICQKATFLNFMVMHVEWRHFIYGVMKKKSGKDLNRIEARFCLKEVEMNSLKIKLQRC